MQAFNNIDNKDITQSNKTIKFYAIYGLLLLSIILISGSAINHYRSYDSKYVSTIAKVNEASCERHAINRSHDEYYCILDVGYNFSGKKLTATLFDNTNEIYYPNDEILIHVEKTNPANIYIPVISNEGITLLFGIGGFISFMFSMGIAYLS